MDESVKRNRMGESGVSDVNGRVRASQEPCQNGQIGKSDEIVKSVTIERKSGKPGKRNYSNGTPTASKEQRT